MSDLLRIIASIFFGVQWVELTDTDGSLHVRRAIFRNGQWGAWRVGMGVRFVLLLGGGRVRGPYTQSWRRYVPFPPRAPFPSDATSQ